MVLQVTSKRIKQIPDKKNTYSKKIKSGDAPESPPLS